MYFRLFIQLTCLALMASTAIAGENALIAGGLGSTDPDKTQGASESENRLVPTIAPIDTVHVGVGNQWEFYLRGRTRSGEPPTIIGVVLPSGAVMTDVGDGWSLIYWQPRPEDVGRHVLTIRAMDKDDPNLVFERDVEVEVQAVDGDNTRESMIPAAASPSGSAVLAAGSSDQAPTLGPIATHIVSAGKTLTIRVTPEYDHELPPIIRIDRLPANASFDANKDGSRTFFWPTGNRDQGQHRFRITVIHPDDASLKTTRELTVIVGDPSQQSTFPTDR